MKLFISYADEQLPIAEEINASLSARGFDVSTRPISEWAKNMTEE